MQMQSRRNLAWLSEQNAKRATERRAQGVQIRMGKGSAGRVASRNVWSARRAAQRKLARERAARRPFVQGRVRLWGKGPATDFYQTLQTFVPAGFSPTTFVPAGSSPRSVLVEPAMSPGSPLSLEGDPCDEDMLALIGEQLALEDKLERRRCEQKAFRRLAEFIGVRRDNGGNARFV